ARLFDIERRAKEDDPRGIAETWHRRSGRDTNSADSDPSRCPGGGLPVAIELQFTRSEPGIPLEKARIRRPSAGRAAPVVRRRGIPGPGKADWRNAMKATTTMRVAAGGVAG